MGWNGHPIFLRRQFQFLENWWNMKHIHSISIWSSEIWPVLASSCQVRWPCCPLLSMAARKQPTSKAARFQQLLTGCAGWRLIAIIHYYSDELSGTQFQRRTCPLQLTLIFWIHKHEATRNQLSPSARTAAVARWRKSCVRPWQNAKAFCPRKAGCFGNVQRGVAQQCWGNSRKSGDFHAKTWVAWWFQAFHFLGCCREKL